MNKIGAIILAACGMWSAYSAPDSSASKDGKVAEYDFSHAELESAQKDVADLIADDLKALATGGKTQLDVARTIERKMRMSKNSKAANFLLAKGAFKLYAEAGDLGNARRILSTLHWQECPSDMLRDMMCDANADYGVHCSNTNCPLILMSFIHGSSDSGETGEKLSDLKSLKFGSSDFSKDAKLYAYSAEHNPLRTWEQSEVCVYRKAACLQLPDGGRARMELFYTKQTKRLFRVTFAANYSSRVERRVAQEEMAAILKMINDAWGIALHDNPVGSDPDESISEEHEKALGEYRQKGTVRCWSSVGIERVSDYGVSDFRGEGTICEDVHNCKSLHMSVVSESNLTLAWKESGVDPNMAKNLNGASQYPDMISYLMNMCMYGESVKGLGMLGRAYEYGHYGTKTNQKLAVSYYVRAYLEGNKDAEIRLKALGKDPEAYAKAEKDKVAAARKKQNQKDALSEIQGLKNLLDFAETLAKAEKVHTDTTEHLDSINAWDSESNEVPEIERLLAGLKTNDAASANTALSVVRQKVKTVKIKDSRDAEHEWKYVEDKNGVTILGLADTGADSREDGVRRIELPAVIAGKKVIAVGKDAFHYYHSLRKVIFPEGLAIIDTGAFYACGELRDVKLPAGLKVIGDQAFGGCDELEEMELPTSLQKIGHNAFSRTALNKVTIPESVCEIGWGAFGECSQLTVVHIGAGVKTIEQGTFAGCRRLQEIHIPSSVDEIKSGVFERCVRLDHVDVDPANVNFAVRDGLLLNKDGSRLISYFGKGQEIELPQSIVAIGDKAFSGRADIKKIGFPNVLLHIGDDAFYECHALEIVHIPAGVEKISRHAFRNCRALKSIDVAKENDFYASVDGILFDKNLKKVMCCPGGKDSVALPATVTDINARAFEGCCKLHSVSVPEGVTKLQSAIFSGCENLTTVTIPKSVAKIEGEIFGGCKNLKSVLFLGDAPVVQGFFGGRIYSWDVKQVTTYVVKGSTGWGVDIPGMWQKRPIQYLQTKAESQSTGK